MAEAAPWAEYLSSSTTSFSLRPFTPPAAWPPAAGGAGGPWRRGVGAGAEGGPAGVAAGWGAAGGAAARVPPPREGAGVLGELLAPGSRAAAPWASPPPPPQAVRVRT